MERWLPVAGFEGLYEVSDFGRVRSLERTVCHGRNVTVTLRSKLRKMTNEDYPSVILFSDGKRHRKQVHLLVIRAFRGVAPTGMQTRHLDGNSKNPRLDNLVYGTPKENQNDRIDHGTSNRGERCGNSKLTEQEVAEIRSLGGREKHRSIAKRYNVRQSTISRIIRGDTWGWMT